MKRLGSGLFGRPEAILFDEVICQDDQLSHDGGQGEFFDLSSGNEALIEALEMRVCRATIKVRLSVNQGETAPCVG